jgi:hypothetical protein
MCSQLPYSHWLRLHGLTSRDLEPSVNQPFKLYFGFFLAKISNVILPVANQAICHIHHSNCNIHICKLNHKETELIQMTYVRIHATYIFNHRSHIRLPSIVAVK